MVRNNYKCKTCRSNTNADPHQPNEAERYQMHLCMACYLKMEIALMRKWLFTDFHPACMDLDAVKVKFIEVFGE